MKSYRTAAREEGLNEDRVTESPSAAFGTTAPETLETRLATIHDYQAKVLTKKSRLGVALGTVNAGLMGVAVHMDTLIEQMLAGETTTLDHVQKLLPAIQAYLQTTRQIDRFAQLELQMAALRKRPNTAMPDQPR